MKLHPFVIVFAFLWLSIVGSLGFTSIFSIWDKETFEPMSLIPLGMIIFFYAIATGGFKYESI